MPCCMTTISKSSAPLTERYPYTACPLSLTALRILSHRSIFSIQFPAFLKSIFIIRMNPVFFYCSIRSKPVPVLHTE